MVIVASYPASVSFFFFFNDTATTEIYTLSLHDALPISCPARRRTGGCSTGTAPPPRARPRRRTARRDGGPPTRDRKSTRLNSSHDQISYAVFCLKKKKIRQSIPHSRSLQLATAARPHLT